MWSSPFLIALQFLTVFPVRMKELPDDKTTGRSLLYYPLVGLLIGLLLLALGWLGNGMPASLHAAAVLAFWVALTGALHLDGLADSADAWIGGLGDHQKTLAIMKDPYCGPAAVVTLVLVLLIKFAALEHLITTENWEALVLAPVLGRAALVLLFLTTPYIRPGGLGNALSEHLTNRSGILVVSLAATGVILLGRMAGFWMLVTAIVVFMLARALLLRRLGGTTGDTAGAMVEITETVMLLTVALME